MLWWLDVKMAGSDWRWRHGNQRQSEPAILTSKASSDGSYEPKRQSLRFSHTQSMVFKLQIQVAQRKRFWYLSHWRAAMAHVSLSILAVPPEPSLFAYTTYGTLATNSSEPAQEILVLIALAISDGSLKPLEAFLQSHQSLRFSHT